MAKILVVDDELGIRDLMFEILNDEGHTVELAENAAEARAARERGQPDLVLLDIWMPDTDGVTLLKEWKGGGLLTMPVVMMSGHATIETAVEATRIGASAFLEKPITLQKLLDAVERATAPGARRPVPAAMARSPGSASAAAAQPQAAAVPAAPISAADLPDEFTDPTLGPQQVFDLDQPLREARDAFEKAYFEYHLTQTGGSMTRVAESTGLERTHLYRKLKQLGVDIADYRRSSSDK